MKLMSKKKFAERVCAYVKKALPHELAEAEVRTARLDLWTDHARIALLVIRPWDGITTGFCLEQQYEDYSNGRATVESAAAAIIGDRRLYCMPTDNGGSDMPGRTAAVIYA